MLDPALLAGLGQRILHLVWRRRNGSLVVETVTGAGVSVLAGANGAELSTDRLVDAVWIGSQSGVEREAAERAGVPFRAIQTGKLRRYLDWRTPVDVARLPVGVGQPTLRIDALTVGGTAT